MRQHPCRARPEADQAAAARPSIRSRRFIAKKTAYTCGRIERLDHRASWLTPPYQTVFRLHRVFNATKASILRYRFCPRSFRTGTRASFFLRM